MFVASVPSVLLAWAEYDLGRALVVIVALTVVNAAAENLVQPALMHKGLHLSPTFVILSVFFWSSLLSGGGSFLAVPMSLGLLTLLANFPAAKWFVDTAMTRTVEPSEHDAPVAAGPARV
jgi:AI-2 transport protein TqsA